MSIEIAAAPFKKEDTVFIQIGSNEGLMATDPLSSFILRDRWKGILIEPVPSIFEKLKTNYADRPHLYFENVAISDTRKMCDFYIVNESSDFLKVNPHLVNEVGGSWGSLVGSLDRNHIFKCKPSLSDKEIKKIPVQCVTLQDIVDKYQLDHIDVIQIDAEGHDEIILSSIDFEKIQPKIIIFEHAHMPFDSYLRCINNLQSHGYSVIYTGPLDTVVGNPLAESLLH